MSATTVAPSSAVVGASSSLSSSSSSAKSSVSSLTMPTRDWILSVRKNRGTTMECFESNEISSATPFSSGTASHFNQEKKRSEDVVGSSLNASAAFARFGGAVFRSQPLANLSNTSTVTTAGGAAGSTSEFDSVYSPLERLGTLRNAFDSFRTELSELNSLLTKKDFTESKGNSEAKSFISAVEKELNDLSGQLSSLASQPPFNELSKPEALTSESVALKKEIESALQQIQQATKSAANTTTSASKSNTDSHQSSTVAPAAAALLVALDRRVSVLEGAVGVHSSANSADNTTITLPIAILPRTVQSAPAHGSQTAATPPVASGLTTALSVATFPDVNSALGFLHQRLSFLDAGKLETIGKQIKSILHDLDTLQETRSSLSGVTAIADSAHVERIRSIYGMMNKWDSIASSVPILIHRLLTLHAVHDSSALLVSRVHELDLTANKLENAQKADRETLEKLSSVMTDNLKAMQENVSTLDSKMQQLMQRIQSLQKK